MLGDDPGLNTPDAIIDTDLSLGRPTGWADGFQMPSPLSNQLHSSQAHQTIQAAKLVRGDMHIHFGRSSATLAMTTLAAADCFSSHTTSNHQRSLILSGT
jgi:hypothetical protein